MIPEDCLIKIRSISEGLGEVFSAIATDMGDLPSVTLVLPMYGPESKLGHGDLAPEIHLVIRRVECPD